MLERIHLAIVAEVERRGSLTAAADVLCVTQSALSHSMKKLEQQLGTDIWLREGRNLRLTQAGQYLLAVANRVLPQLALAEERLHQFAQGERGTLRIGMECHPCYQWLLKVVSPYLAGWPDVDVDVKQKFQFGGIGALLGYEIDVLVTPDPLHKPGLRFEPVFDYEQVLVVARGHPLARRRRIALAETLEHDYIGMHTGSTLQAYLNRITEQMGRTLKLRIQLTSFDAMCRMVSGGVGIGVVPESAARRNLQAMKLAQIELTDEWKWRERRVLVREGDTLPGYAQDLIEMLCRHFDHPPGLREKPHTDQRKP